MKSNVLIRHFHALSERNLVAFGPEMVDTSRTAKSYTTEAI